MYQFTIFLLLNDYDMKAMIILIKYKDFKTIITCTNNNIKELNEW
jgi:hypothetical protein